MTDKITKFHDVQTDYIQDGDRLQRKTTQHLPDEFLKDLRRTYEDSLEQREGEFMKVASIPVAVADKWMREGFNIYNASGKEILKRLRDENLDAFITTKKSI